MFKPILLYIGGVSLLCVVKPQGNHGRGAGLTTAATFMIIILCVECSPCCSEEP